MARLFQNIGLAQERVGELAEIVEAIRTAPPASLSPTVVMDMASALSKFDSLLDQVRRAAKVEQQQRKA